MWRGKGNAFPVSGFKGRHQIIQRTQRKQLSCREALWTGGSGPRKGDQTSVFNTQKKWHWGLACLSIGGCYQSLAMGSWFGKTSL